MYIDLIAGARPNFVKLASVVSALQLYNTNSNKIDFRIIHTGQHYDKNMSGDFFDQLDLPLPDVNFNVGSGSQAAQCGSIMLSYESLLVQRKSDLCVVFGDVTSTMACAISAKKSGVSVAHVEAGIRSGDLTMPEEINRIVTDSIADLFFTTSEFANFNLIKSGVAAERIYLVGNTMIDSLLQNIQKFRKPSFWTEFQLSDKNYFVLTLHRPANVDNPVLLESLIVEIAKSVKDFSVIFPVHPRTRMILASIPNLPGNVNFVDPLPYLEFNYLVRNSLAVLTDSGGISEETTFLHVPCITLRNTTERPETVEIGTNQLVGSDLNKIKHAIDMVLAGDWKRGEVPPYWDGFAGKRIVEILSKFGLAM